MRIEEYTIYTRVHSLKLFKLTCNLDVWKSFLTHRLVNIWNSLTDEIQGLLSVLNFFVGHQSRSTHVAEFQQV